MITFIKSKATPTRAESSLISGSSLSAAAKNSLRCYSVSSMGGYEGETGADEIEGAGVEIPTYAGAVTLTG
jgi:hypothetical protein